MDNLTLENNHKPTTEEIKNHTKALYKAFKESIVKNKWFYFALLFCFYLFKQYSPSTTSYIILVYSFIFILIFGHFIHRVSHNINFTEIYNKHKKHSTHNYIDYGISKLCEFFDFHRVIHHDTSINKKFSNIAYEFINNFMIQGGLIVLFVWFYNNYIDNRVVLLWALMYSTVHNINYLFIKPTVHRDHHLHDDTNYGIDIADIIFDTKWNINDIEDHNHYSINIILITICIIYISYLLR